MQLQLVALEVEVQRKAAREEREGLSLHDGYQKATKDFRAACNRACSQEFVGTDWLEQCCMKAGLIQDYREWLVALRLRKNINSWALLTWSPPYGC